MAITADMITNVSRFYVALFGRAPDGAPLAAPSQDGLSYWTQELGNGISLPTVANQMFATVEARAYYPGYYTNEQIANSFYINVLGRTPDAAGLAYWTAALNTAPNVGTVLYQMVVATTSYVAGSNPDPAIDAAALSAQALFNNRVTVAEYYGTHGGNIAGATAALAGVTSDPATIVTAEYAIDHPAVPGTTFTLTTGVDNFTGGAGNDVFNAAAVDSLSAFDSLNGGAGTNSLNANLTTTTLGGAITVSGIQSATFGATGAGFTADVSGWTGLTSLKLSDTAAGAIALTSAATTANTVVATGASSVMLTGGGVSANVTTGAAAVNIGAAGSGAAINAFAAITVSGGTTVDIADNKTAVANSGAGTTLKTVSVSGNTGFVNVKATTLTALNLTNDTAGATVTGNTGALALGLNAVTGGTITDAGATSLAIANTVAASSGLTVVAGAATGVTVSATTKALSLTALTAGVATTVGISGDAAVTITADTFKSTAVITSTNTGGVTLTQALVAGQQFVGTSSSGADTITVGASTTAITTGDGNDTVTMSVALGTGGSVDAGGGTGDILSMASADAATLSAATTFQGTISNFEVLKLGATGAADVVKVNNLDDISTVISAGVTAGGLTLSGLAATNSVTFTGAIAAASSLALKTDTTADVVNLKFAATDGFTNTAALTIAGVETLNITTSDTDSTAATMMFVAPITAAAVKSVVIAGNAGFDATGLTATTITSLDASGLTLASTVGGLTWTSGALAASSVIKGSAGGTNTINFSAANTASTFVTYTGGSGADNVTGANGLANVVSLGNGTNAYTGGSGAESVTGGTGVDTIMTAAGADSIVGGGGADKITAGAGADKITISGTTATVYQAVGDSGTNTSTALQTSELTTTFDVIYGATAGIQIDLTAAVAAIPGITTDLAGINLAGVENTIVFARGTYNAGGTFTYDVAGADTAVTYDTVAGAGGLETIILVGYVTGVTTGTGLLALA